MWAPDGAHLAFATNVDGYWTLQVKGVRDTDARQVLPSDHVSRQPQTWVSDDTLVYQELNQNGIDLWQVRLSTPGSRTLLVGGPGDQIHAAISPDRRWLAYASNETGRYEVYVRRYGGQERWQVSAAGGVEPRWRADTRELFFLRLDGALCAVGVPSGTQFEAGPAAVLWRAKLWDIGNGAFWHYAPTADGSRFLVNTVLERDVPQLHVAVNWEPE